VATRCLCACSPRRNATLCGAGREHQPPGRHLPTVARALPNCAAARAMPASAATGLAAAARAAAVQCNSTCGAMLCAGVGLGHRWGTALITTDCCSSFLINRMFSPAGSSSAVLALWRVVPRVWAGVEYYYSTSKLASASRLSLYNGAGHCPATLQQWLRGTGSNKQSKY
jgi:hypothetical protein